MKYGCRLLLLLLFLPAACAGLPEIRDLAGPGDATIARACLGPFPNRPMQFLHALKVVAAGQKRVGILGVVQVWPRTRRLHCMMMTIEGLVVFEARYDGGRLAVHRALPPFDAPEMAAGMMADIEMIFLPPRGRFFGSGSLASGGRVCRYLLPDESVVDVVSFPDGRWQLCRYDAGGRRNRTVSVPAGDETIGKPLSRLVLTAHAIPGYRLTMDLIESMPLAAGDAP